MTHPVCKLVTVIAEASLERELVREIDALHIGGYTITEARGRGGHGDRASSWSHSANIRMEVLCDTAVAEQLMARVSEKYFANYAVVLYAQDVEVLRPEKF